MENKNSQSALLQPVPPLNILLSAAVILLTILFCFLPDRLLIAAMLFVLLLLIMNRIDNSSSILNTGFVFENSGREEQSKRNRKMEFGNEHSFGRILEILKNKQSVTTEIQTKQLPTYNGKSIIKNIDRNSKNKIKYSLEQKRLRREIKDEEIERRIQTIFAKIRKSDQVTYEKGIEEIQELLIMRQNFLWDLPAYKNDSIEKEVYYL